MEDERPVIDVRDASGNKQGEVGKLLLRPDAPDDVTERLDILNKLAELARRALSSNKPKPPGT